MNRPTRHSYSSIACYGTCPAKYSYRYIAKLAEETSAAMERGSRLHTQAETYLLGPQDMACPYELRRIGLLLYQMREKKALPEDTWYVDAGWNKTTDADAAKVKCIVDVHYVHNGVLFLHDFKSGRAYPSHVEQLELYSIVGLQHYPDVKRVESSAIYIDTGIEASSRSMLREMVPHYSKNWSTKIARIEADKKFLPAPGNHCRYCAFGASKGGPCLAEGADRA